MRFEAGDQNDDSISTRIAVLNSLLFIRDQSIEDIPEIDGNGAVWSTTSCVAVSILFDHLDHPTLRRYTHYVWDKAVEDATKFGAHLR